MASYDKVMNNTLPFAQQNQNQVQANFQPMTLLPEFLFKDPQKLSITNNFDKSRKFSDSRSKSPAVRSKTPQRKTSKGKYSFDKQLGAYKDERDEYTNNEFMSFQSTKLNDPLLAPPDILKLIATNFKDDSFMPLIQSSEESVKLDLKQLFTSPSEDDNDQPQTSQFSSTVLMSTTCSEFVPTKIVEIVPTTAIECPKIAIENKN